MDSTQAFVRSVTRAVDQDVKIFETADGQAFATSVSNEGHLHRVGVHSCECLGFQHHGQCKHNAAFVVALAGALFRTVGMIG